MTGGTFAFLIASFPLLAATVRPLGRYTVPDAKVMSTSLPL